jgi:hypothetical protein
MAELSTADRVTALSVSGFKSIFEERRLPLAPLTILAGANSSGKSSMMQPLLLMKQTLEASFDPGPLLMEGPNVRITSTEQMLSHIGSRRSTGFSISFEATDPKKAAFVFSTKKRGGIQLDHVTLTGQSGEQILRESAGRGLALVRDRCFLALALDSKRATVLPYAPFEPIVRFLEDVIHVPGLRANPERLYLTTGTGDRYPGTFDNYVASLLFTWQERGHAAKLDQLGRMFERLGLTSKVQVHRVSDTRSEIRVGRLPRRQKTANDFVNIADVGFGTSQTLPILVALLAAKSENTVYIEQPETHLHPRAQVAMASILAGAVKRGVKLIIETHSSLLLRGLQTAVAEGNLAPESVSLNWFTRNQKGATDVASTTLDATGAFGDCPADFDDVTLQADQQYLDAVEKRQIA